MASSQQSTESIAVRLGSPDSQVDATAVASTMQAIIAIVDEAQKVMAAQEQVLIKARPFASGSFEIPLDLIVIGTAGLFSVHPLIDNILNLLKDYIELKTLLRGQPVPEPSGNGTIVVQGNTINISHSVINILSNNRIGTALDRAVTDIAADETIRDVKMFRGAATEPFIVIPRTELDFLRNHPSGADTERPDRERVVRCTLTLRSLVFEGSGKWRFNYDGATISADIRDEDFKRRVVGGIEEFAAGDRLDVELVIAERYNPVIADYERKNQYSIARVFSHTKNSSSSTSHSEQPDLPFGDDLNDEA